MLALMWVAPSAHADIAMMDKLLKQTPQLTGFDICYGGGCALQGHASIGDEEWQSVQALFDEVATAEEERHAIAKALGLFEEIVGAQTGTDADKAGTFGNSAYSHQLDCNDEATNSTTYLKLLMDAGLIEYHQILDTKTRKFFFNGWPHTTAVIEEKQNQQKYAVDSWFYDNGQPAEVILLEQWLDGWKPPRTLAH